MILTKKELAEKITAIPSVHFKNSDMVIIIVWITILMCAIGAIALYIVKGNSVKSKKVKTIKNKFSL